MNSEIRTKLRKLVVDDELKETYMVVLAFLAVGLISPHVIGYDRAMIVVMILGGLMLFGFHFVWFTRDAREEGEPNPRLQGGKELVSEIVFALGLVIGVFALGFVLNILFDIPVLYPVIAAAVITLIGLFGWFSILMYRYLFTDTVEIDE